MSHFSMKQFAGGPPVDKAKRMRHVHRLYERGGYWRDRMDLMYYQYLDYIMRTVARDAQSMIDVGTANCPYQEWFDWIPDRVSFDRVPPYSSDQVTGIQGDFLTHKFKRRFDVCTCLQVLEHVPEVEAFTKRLLDIADLTIISVPHCWPAHAMEDHIHDPVTQEKLVQWAGREPNYQVVVEEPFRVRKRLIAVFDNVDPDAGYGRRDFRQRRRREEGGLGP